jgi:UDP-N-acetylmuramoyl-tripeptide--D-alanyl-D-alanine ligase
MVQIADVFNAVVSRSAENGLPEALRALPLSGVVIDSRQVTTGSLFVALPGEQTDGHLYLAESFKRGALVALAEDKALGLGLEADFIFPDGHVESRGEGIKPPLVFLAHRSATALQQLAGYWRSRLPVQVVAVTGSVGKTTTKETISNVLSTRFDTLHSEGNLNNELGLPLTLLRLTQRHQRAVLEMGMYDLGEISELCRIAQPRIGVVTNVGPTHLERLGSLDTIAAAKSELVQALPSESEGGVAILNADDDRVRAMASMTRARVFLYGLSSSCDLWADDIVSEGLEGISFRLHYGSDSLKVRVPMLGRHSVHTALRAAAVGLMESLSWGEIVSGLQRVHGQLRLMVVPGLRDTTIVDDTYNASPVSMLAALNLLDDIANSEHRAIAVLGDMLELGAYEEEGHRVVGGRAARVTQKLVTVGPRARWIADAAILSGMPQADVYQTETNQDALAVLQGLIRPKDIILVKGSRGQAMEAIVDGLSRPRRSQAGDHV